MKKANFSHIQNSKKDDWDLIAIEHGKFESDSYLRILSQLKLLDLDNGGFPVTRLQHCLQAATLAMKNRESEEYIICALLHDIGDVLCPANHSEVAAAIVQPFVSEELHWIVQNHNIFQGYFYFEHLGIHKDLRQQHKDNVHYEATERFVRLYDSPSFDQDAKTPGLDEFESTLKKVFSNPRNSVWNKWRAQTETKKRKI